MTGLYAAGECACVSVHGANRLGGNALMETITFGKRAGRAAAEWALTHTTISVPPAVEADTERELKELLARSEGERPWAIRDELATTMHENFGVFRREEQMLEQGRIIEGLRERYKRVVVDDKGEIFNNDLTQAIELGFMLDLAECMVVAGLARKESRGAHARPHDYPDRDDEKLPQAHDDHLRGRRRGSAWLESGDDDQVEAEGEDVLVATESLVRSEYATMTVALKIWRFDASTGERELRDYEVEAPEWACLLDVLDLIKDKVDGSLAYRKSCRMMICGSCGMRMDGAAVLACKERMKPIVDRGHVPVISAMGNLPIIRDLVVDMGPFWNKIRAVKPWLDPGYDEVAEKERIVSQQAMNVIHKEALCIMCGCCVSECNSMESDPDFLGPAALAKGFRFVGDPREQDQISRLNKLNEEHGIWDCTRCYFCNERCPKGVDPRDAIAKLGAESMKEGIDHDMGAKHARWFVISAKTTGWLRETELVPKTQGVVSAIKETKFALNLFRRGKVPLPFPPHVADRIHEARGLYDIVRNEGRRGALGIVQSERALAKIDQEHPEGAGEGWGSRAQADITPGARPTAGKGGEA